MRTGAGTQRSRGADRVDAPAPGPAPRRPTAEPSARDGETGSGGSALARLGDEPRDVDVPEAVVQGVVSWIAGVLREKQLEFVLTVARGVIDAFFDGDLGEWRRRGQQSTSIRALASRLQEEAVMSAMTLYRYLSVYELVERIGGASALGDLAVTHCYAVLPLRDRPEAQLELLQRADEGTWTTRDLEAAVAGVRGSRDAEERRPRRGSLHGELARLGREARALLQRAKAGEGVGSAEQRERTFALVGAAIEGLEGIRQRSYPKGERARTLA